MDEIGIKFNCNWIEEGPLSDEHIEALNAWRNKLFNLGLIGVYDNGIGYGNMSIRYQQNKFIITGTATGRLPTLTASHYTQVTAYDLNANSLTTVGPIKASSESLTHALIYEHDENINAVVHVHHLKLWEKILHAVPTTEETIEYGTTAMAREIQRLFKETNLSEGRIFAMAGHREGIVTFGKDIADAAHRIIEELNALAKLE